MEIVGKHGPSVSENEPVLGSLVLRDWRFQVKEASLFGVVQPVGPAGPVSPGIGRWSPKLRGKQRLPPTQWSLTWHVEINTYPQRDPSTRTPRRGSLMPTVTWTCSSTIGENSTNFS